MSQVVRRARPALGTLVELGVHLPGEDARDPPPAWVAVVLEAGWQALAAVERAMSAFLPGSDVWRFNAAPAGAAIPVGEDTASVLRAARALQRASRGLLDVSTGTGPWAWSLRKRDGQDVLCKRAPEVRLDLGGVAKDFAVDRAAEAMEREQERAGRRAASWVNAGGDLRTLGVAVPVHLRDEGGGGARPWLELRQGAVATSHFGASTRSRLAGGAPGAEHVSVVSPCCLWSDMLTKVVALSGRADHPLLARHGARAWVHAGPPEPAARTRRRGGSGVRTPP